MESSEADIFTHTIFLLPGSWLDFVLVWFCLFFCFYENVHGGMSFPFKLLF